MKTKSAEGFVILTNAETGEQVSVPNGTKVTVLDQIGEDRLLMTEHVTGRDDWPCMYGEAMYFVSRHSLVRNQDA